MKPFVYLCIALGMLIYAVPQLRMGQGMQMPTVFGVVWLAMVLLIIASQLHQILGVDAEKRKQLDRVHRYSKWRREQMIHRNIRGFQSRK